MTTPDPVSSSMPRSGVMPGRIFAAKSAKQSRPRTGKTEFRRVGAFQSRHQGHHLPGVTGELGLLEADDAPASKDLPKERLSKVVADPLGVQAGAQQEPSTRAQHTPDLGGVAGPVGGPQVVQAATVKDNIEAGSGKRQLQHVGLDELHRWMQAAGTLECGNRAVDPDGERHATLGQVRQFAAEPAAKVQHAPRDAEPAVRKRGQELG